MLQKLSMDFSRRGPNPSLWLCNKAPGCSHPHLLHLMVSNTIIKPEDLPHRPVLTGRTLASGRTRSNETCIPIATVSRLKNVCYLLAVKRPIDTKTLQTNKLQNCFLSVKVSNKVYIIQKTRHSISS